ncbi:hypothetical protein Hanom_Chr07g00680131 [Helianthus anomalus]
MQNYYRVGVSLKAASLLFLRGRGKTVYILPFSDLTLALLLVEFSEYCDDDDDGDNNTSKQNSHSQYNMICHNNMSRRVQWRTNQM